MSDNSGTSPSHKANRFVELLSEAENIARDIAPEVELLVPTRFKPYVSFMGALISAFENADGPTATDAVVPTGDTPQAVIERHAVLQAELMGREPLPDPPPSENDEVESVNAFGSLVGETPPPTRMS